jgi:hypothetical protein
MNQNNHDPGWVDSRLFLENQRRFPPDELAKYAGQCVAWSLDGTKILASGADLDSAEEQLRQAGVSTRDVVWSSVPAPGEDAWL